MLVDIINTTVRICNVPTTWRNDITATPKAGKSAGMELRALVWNCKSAELLRNNGRNPV